MNNHGAVAESPAGGGVVTDNPCVGEEGVDDAPTRTLSPDKRSPSLDQQFTVKESVSK